MGQFKHKTQVHLKFLFKVQEYPGTLRRIPSDLMKELLSSPYLYVMQTEFSVYVMLKVSTISCLKS